MAGTCVDSAQRELSSILEHSPWCTDHFVDKIHALKAELRFLRTFLYCFPTWDDTDSEIRQILQSLSSIFDGIWEEGSRKELVAARLLPIRMRKINYWALLSADLESRIQKCKQEFDESCELLLNCSLKCKSFEINDILKFLDAILKNLKDLVKYKGHEIVIPKDQIETLEKKLILLHNFFNLAPEEWRNSKEMWDFKILVHSFANNSACLTFLYWVKAKAADEEMTSKTNLLLSDVLKKIESCNPVVTAFCIRLLKDIKLRQCDSFLLGQIVPCFFDLVLEYFLDPLTDVYENFRVSLIFLVAFLADPPEESAQDEVLMIINKEIEVLFNQDFYLILSVDHTKEDFSEEKVIISDFMKKGEMLKDKIRQLYFRTPDSFSYNFPRTDGLGFFTFLLQNLGVLKVRLNIDRNFLPFATRLILGIEEELVSLRPCLNDLFNLQKEQKEVKDTWLQVINLAYQTEYIISSCSLIGNSMWYNMACLFYVLDEIKVVRRKIENTKCNKTYYGEALPCSAVVPSVLSEETATSGFSEVVVGFEEEADIIIGNLTRGSKFLDIVSIVGMAGLGKTTLTKKVCKSLAVRYHFHVLAYCVVSQVHSTKKILLDLLGDIVGKDDKIVGMEQEDLVEKLYKCLKGKRYLIVMDDIWDVRAWDAVKRSFPDDKIGSRVMFTTRIRNVALRAKSDCILHDLRFLSEEECWELLQKKVFHIDGCPQKFSEVGKWIARKCKGLPLAIVLIAGLLARTERSLSWWNEIAERIGSYVSMEGCIDILELSYQHLPEHLKSCFLYIGSFAEHTLVRVNKLTMLWISEGFVQASNSKSLEDVAKDYLCDLVDRSLVIASRRSSNGGIKRCRVHDVVRDFCLAKAQEDNFFRLIHRYAASNSSNCTACNPYRVIVQMDYKSFADHKAIGPSVHSLLYCHKKVLQTLDPSFFSNIKLVQVMDLEDLLLHPLSIDKITLLVHLKFIKISFSGYDDIKVPSSISNLWNLESFMVQTDQMVELPETIWNMTSLRHVHVGRCKINNSGKRISMILPQLVNLESFSSPTLSLRELKEFVQRLPSLRKLSFDFSVPWVYKEFEIQGLDSLSKLESLKVVCRDPPFVNNQFFLQRLPNIPSTLKKLSLSSLYLPWTYMSAVVTIRGLEVLKLLENSFDGPIWDIDEMEFPKLKFLKLEGLSLVEWIAFKDTFPRLEVLIVNKCYKLDEVPACFGEIATLKSIEVYASKNAASSVVQIQEEQMDIGNEELKVIISDYNYETETTDLV